MAKRFVATETFRAVVDGFADRVVAGITVVDEDHELVRKFPERFEPVKETRPVVEQATQAPGEGRGKPK